MNNLKCPVCNEELELNEKCYRCKNNHCYDLSKKGSVNLMLANQGHSSIKGDNKEMIEARNRFLNKGFYDVLKNKLIEIIDSLSEKECNFVDVACGEGYYTNSIHKALSSKISTIGIDISKEAILTASKGKNMQNLTNIDYVVGNINYLPLMPSRFDIMLNCFGPIDEKEFNRVLKHEGYYIRVLPNINHLYDFKKYLFGDVRLYDNKEKTLNGFELVDQVEVEDNISLNRSDIEELFTMTPYYYRCSREVREKVACSTSLTTKIEFMIRIYKKL